MAEIIKKWEGLHIGWKLYVAGCVFIVIPVWANHSLSDASIAAGVCTLFGAFMAAVVEIGK